MAHNPNAVAGSVYASLVAGSVTPFTEYAPPNQDKPYAVIKLPFSEPEYVQAGGTSHTKRIYDEQQVWVNCWGTTIAQARQLAGSVSTLLDSASIGTALLRRGTKTIADPEDEHAFAVVLQYETCV